MTIDPDQRGGAPAALHDERTRPQRGEELELTVESLAYGGEGVARVGDGGYVVFVAGAIPGDRVRAVVHKRKRSYAHARTLEVLEPSPERIAPVASHPGVPWQVLPYERQLEVKGEQVLEALQRLGHLGDFHSEPIVPAVERWRYRNKLEYSFGVGADDELVCGFHASAGARRVEPIEDCLLASERGNLARQVVLRWCRSEGLSAWDRGFAGDRAGSRGEGFPRDSHGDGEGVPRNGSRARAREGHSRGGPDGGDTFGEGRRGRRAAFAPAPAPDGRARLRNVVVREGRDQGLLQVRLVTTPGELDAGSLATELSRDLDGRLSGVLWTRSDRLAETTLGGETELIWGQERLPERLGELALEISPEAFFQTNTEMAVALYDVVREYAGLEGWERVYDLCSGIGTIGLSLASRAGEVWGVELIPDAVSDAIAIASDNQIGNAHFFAGDVRTELGKLTEKAGRPDVVVVDPPRAGLSKKTIRRIVEAAPRRIVYVSCNPTTLAPNAAELAQAGWALRRVRAVDMFPHTHHIECVALLERDAGPTSP